LGTRSFIQALPLDPQFRDDAGVVKQVPKLGG
jgi:hypothetical protein